MDAGGGGYYGAGIGDARDVRYPMNRRTTGIVTLDIGMIAAEVAPTAASSVDRLTPSIW